MPSGTGSRGWAVRPGRVAGGVVLAGRRERLGKPCERYPGPAARTGAAGARGRGAPLRGLRRRRGRRPGGAAGRGDPVAPGRDARQPARLADPGGRAPADRSVPQRGCPAPPGGAGRLVVTDGPARPGARRGCPGPGRHADPHVHVLPPVALPGRGHPAHAARGRRPDHAGDRGRVPGAGTDHGTADQPGQGHPESLWRAIHAAAPGPAGRAAPVRAARPVPPVQRGVRQQRRSRPGAERPVRRGHQAGPGAALQPARRPGGDRAAGADAAHRRAAARPDRARR